MRPPWVMVVTDLALDAEARAAKAAARAGAWLQVRAKGRPAAELAALARALRGARRLSVNDRLDVALAAGADGVHLPEDGLAPSEARRLAPRGFLIGRSMHVPGPSRGSDYLVAGPVFATACKPGARPLGLDGLRAVLRAARVPVLAVGGLDAERAAAVVAAGASGVVLRSHVLGSDDPVGRVSCVYASTAAAWRRRRAASRSSCALGA